MQQKQPERRFNAPPQQPVYRFPQNQPANGWQSQQHFYGDSPVQEPPFSTKDKRELKHAHKRRRRILTWWNLFAVIGMIAVIIQAARYLIIPLLVQLNVLSGGAL